MDEIMTTSACEALMQIIRQDKDKRIAELEEKAKHWEETAEAASKTANEMSLKCTELEQENERLRMDVFHAANAGKMIGMERAAEIVEGPDFLGQYPEISEFQDVVDAIRAELGESND